MLVQFAYRWRYNAFTALKFSAQTFSKYLLFWNYTRLLVLTAKSIKSVYCKKCHLQRLYTRIKQNNNNKHSVRRRHASTLIIHYRFVCVPRIYFCAHRKVWHYRRGAHGKNARMIMGLADALKRALRSCIIIVIGQIVKFYDT